MTERLDFIESFSSSENPNVLNFDRSSIFNALVMCLSPEDACNALDPSFEQPYPERRAIVRKLRCDIAASVGACHTCLLDSLLSGFPELPAKRRSTAAGTLLELADAMGPSSVQRSLQLVCSQPQAAIRRRAYTYLRHTDEDNPLPQCVVEAFDAYSDLGAAQLLVRRGASDDLIARFDRLVEALRGEKFSLSRLFIRLGQGDPGLLSELETINPVSHAYVCAKLGIRLGDQHMVDLYAATMFSDDSGLVAWCCGQMGLWTALKAIAALAEDPPDSAYRRLMDRTSSA